MKDLRKKLERVQNYYGMRIILAQPPRTTSEELRGKPNWRTQEMERNESDGTSSEMRDEECSAVLE